MTTGRAAGKECKQGNPLEVALAARWEQRRVWHRSCCGSCGSCRCRRCCGDVGCCAGCHSSGCGCIGALCGDGGVCSCRDGLWSWPPWCWCWCTGDTVRGDVSRVAAAADAVRIGPGWQFVAGACFYSRVGGGAEGRTDGTSTCEDSSDPGCKRQRG